MTTSITFNIDAVHFASLLQLNGSSVKFKGGVTTIHFSNAPSDVLYHAQQFIDLANLPVPHSPEDVKLEDFHGIYANLFLSIPYREVIKKLEIDFFNKQIYLSIAGVKIVFVFSPHADSNEISRFIAIFQVNE